MLLTWLIVLPLAGALPLLMAREENAPEVKVWAFVASLVTFLVSLPLWFNFEPTGAAFQFVEFHRWIDIGSLRANFNLGVDGISALLILLTTFLTPIVMLSSWNYIQKRQKEFYIAMLALETAMIGVFAARDLFLFYVFFEASLIPMYLIIGIWGGENRLYATTKFVLYTVFGSLLMFIAILFVYFKTGASSFAFADILQGLNNADGRILSRTQEYWCFWAFALAFAIKIPLFPVHTWLPDAHVEAPTPGSVILAGVLLKMGGYGFIRMVIPFFPVASNAYAGTFAVLCIIGILYGSFMAFTQKDIKKLIAYSSVAHMGTCMLGIFSFTAVGMQGGVYQMVNHGISTGALFLLVGMLYERTHTRAIEYYGGLAKSVPALTVCFIIVTLSSIGLPLTNGFVGEFTCLLGAFQANVWWAAFAGLGVILGAVYMLYLVLRVFFGPLLRESNRLMPDLSGRELAVMLPLLVMIFVLGVMPNPFFKHMQPAVTEVVEIANAQRTPAKPGNRKGKINNTLAQNSQSQEPPASTKAPAAPPTANSNQPTANNQSQIQELLASAAATATPPTPNSKQPTANSQQQRAKP